MTERKARRDGLKPRPYTKTPTGNGPKGGHLKTKRESTKTLGGGRRTGGGALVLTKMQLFEEEGRGGSGGDSFGLK